MRGRVKWFDDTKGFGFIQAGNSEYFVHWKSIVTNSDRDRKFLMNDEEVEFDTMDTEKGVQAINVMRLNP